MRVSGLSFDHRNNDYEYRHRVHDGADVHDRRRFRSHREADMNPELLLLLLKNNEANVKNIINTIGVENLFKLMPDIIAILETLQAAPAKPAGT
jgi:hypothetical protein